MKRVLISHPFSGLSGAAAHASNIFPYICINSRAHTHVDA